MTTAPATIDEAKVEALAGQAFGYIVGAAVSGMIYLGDRLGLYRALSDAGPVTSEQFAAATGLSERWLREWLRGQVAAGIVENDGERFSLSPEAHLIFVDETTPASCVGLFDSLPEQFDVLRQLPESFRTGIGITYDDGGPGVAAQVERMFAPWNRSALLDEALPAVPGFIERLRAGAKVGDLGCGAGVAAIEIARAFPNSEVHGFDNSRHALERAEANLAEAGVPNCVFHNPDTEPIPADGSFDLFIVTDALHDMARPDLAMKAVRRALKPDGTWFIVDINCADDWHGNLENPVAPAMYAFSVMTCLASSASQQDGLALGTAGLPQGTLFAMLREAGFTRMETVPGIEHPLNAYYYAQP